MNKYQEALDKLEYFAVQYENTKTGEQWDEIADEIQSCKKILQELVDKSIPKTPIYSDFEEDDDGDGVIPNTAECPVCGYEFEYGYWNDDDNHHCICGQKMDWEWIGNRRIL